MLNKSRYTEGYETWLRALNYAPNTVKTYPLMAAKLLDYVMEKGVKSIDEINANRVKGFFEYLSKTPTKRTGAPYSLATLRNYLTVIKVFAEYIRQTDQGQIEVSVKYEGRSERRPEVLSVQEIGRLYESVEGGLLGMRDRAMLSVYYGCGLRRTEGASLEVKDILPDRNLIYVRKGKNYKERYVPMVGGVKQDIITYLTIGRPSLLNGQVHEQFFVGRTGKPLGGSMIWQRLKKLLKQAGIDRQIGLHSLRHSIATHLLHQGMKLTDIAKLLGHSTLESTQIYTHIEAENEMKNNKQKS